MGEKKEKQYAVLKIVPNDGKLASIVWFDSRQEARNYAKEKNKTGDAVAGLVVYEVHPMTRGPRA